MTFIPSVLSKIDPNNVFIGNYTDVSGNWTSTVGYDTIQVSLDMGVDSVPNGLIVQFSNVSTGTPVVTYSYTDTYLSTSPFTKRYNILDSYYRIIYTSSANTAFNITTRLCVDSYNQELNSLNSFNNNVEYTRDAFGKLRVSFPNTLLDLKFPTVDDTSGNPNFLNNSLLNSSSSSGAGVTGTYSNAQLNASLNSSPTGSYYISQSRKYCVYQPGKSLLILCSGIMDSSSKNSLGNYNQTGVKTRIGYYNYLTDSSGNPLVSNPYNGLYFEHVNQSDVSGNPLISVNIANSGIVSPSNSISQANWNIDPLNGSGSSGINLDFRKTQLFVIDIEWLGVGRIRFGFYIYGKIVYCHQITNINALTGPYTTSMNLPICYSIYNSSGTAKTGAMTQICATAISEGGYEPIGRPFSALQNSSVSLSGTTEKIILAIRGGGTNYYHQNIIPVSMEVVDSVTTNINFWRLRLFRDNTTTNLTATWTSVDSSYSVTQYADDVSGSTTGSIIIAQGIFSGKGNINLSDLTGVFKNGLLELTANINNVADILAITVQSSVSSGTPKIFSSINWNEYY
jgi:hypothetical protein